MVDKISDSHASLVSKDTEIDSLKAICIHNIEEISLSKANNASLKTILRYKDDKTALLKATLKNSKPIDNVDLTKMKLVTSAA